MLLRTISKISSNYLLILLLVVCAHCAYAQTAEVDSLYAALSSTTLKSERIEIINSLTSELIDIDLKEAHAYAKKAVDLTHQKNNIAQVKAQNNMGLILYETAERTSAITYFQKSERLAEALGDRRFQSINLMSIAKYHRYVSKDSTKTVQNLLKSAEISKIGNHNWCTGRSYAKLASFYTKYNQTDLSEEFLEHASKYYMQLDDGALAMAHYYNEVGEQIWDRNHKKAMDFFLKGMKYSDIPNLKASLAKAYSFIGDHQKALKYIEEAIPYFRKKENAKRMLGIAIAQLAEIHMQLGNYSIANNACDEGILLLTDLGRTNQKAMPSLFRVKGIIAEKEGNDNAALEYYTKSLDEAKRIKNGIGKTKAILSIGNFYSTRNPQKGKILCTKSLKAAKKTRLTHLEIESCNCLFNIYKKEETYSNALYFHEQKTQLLDSLSQLKIKQALDITTKISSSGHLIFSPLAYWVSYIQLS